MKINVPEHIKGLMTKLIDNGFEAYIVGGAVRDSIMGIIPNDYDIFTNCDGTKLMEIFYNGNVIGNEQRQAKILTVVVEGVEISQYRSSSDRLETGGTIESHCQTCDLTINALATDINGVIYDYVDGLRDIINKVISFVGDPYKRIAEDPCRVPRALRIYAKLGFWFDMGSISACRESVEMVKKLPVERVMKEIFKAFESDHPDIFLHEFYDMGLLGYYFPEYENMHYKQNPEHHPEGGLLAHIFKGVANCDPEYRFQYFLHDYGKPSTAVWDKEKDCYSFYGHDEKGAELIRRDLKKLKLSNDLIESCALASQYHMQAHFISINPSRRSIRRFQSRVGLENLPMLRAVVTADAFGRRPVNEDLFIVTEEEWVLMKPIVTGEFLISKGFKPGKELGYAKQECFAIQLETGLTDPESIFILRTF